MVKREFVSPYIPTRDTERGADGTSEGQHFNYTTSSRANTKTKSRAQGTQKKKRKRGQAVNMLFRIAYTVSVNSASASPTLTKDEVWRGLMGKARRPQDYVPVINHCEVLSENENRLIRNADIQPGKFMPGGPTKEEVTWVEKIRVCAPFTTRP